MGVAAITKRCGHRACIQCHLAHTVINALRGDARFHHGGHFIKNARSKAPCLAHAFKAFFGVKFDGSVAVDGVCAIDELVFGHGRAYSDWSAEMRAKARDNLPVRTH